MFHCKMLGGRQMGLFLRTVVCCCFVLGLSNSARAINITMVFNAGANQAPAFDPTAAGLISLFARAEAFYEDVFEDAHNLTLNFWYEDLSGGTVGLHTLVSQGGVPNRETVGNIRIDTRVGTGGALRNWFIDPTPADNSEFAMQQTLWRDLTLAQQNDFYNFGANIPTTFEVGFTGAANAGGPAAGLLDMLSVVLHEVGHALGMSSANNSTIAQTGDNDYDFNSAFVFGRTLAAEVADGPNIAHLDDSFALMFPSVSTGVRTLPSHTDLFSMASGHFYFDLDVPRREFYGGNDWNTSGNWSGNAVPGSADDAYVRNAGAIVTANLSAAGFAANLVVSEGSNVDTKGFKLDVTNAVTISDVDSDIFVRTGGELEAASVTVQNNAELNVEGGLVDVNTITLTQGTTLTFLQGTGGTIDVQTNLNNNATIRAQSNGTLTFTSTGGSVWDLDGTSGNGVVQAINGNLNFASGSLTDSFDGDIDVGDGTNARTLTIAQPWTLGSGGVVDLAGGPTVATRAAIAGGTWTATVGDINANAGFNQVQSPVVLGSGVDVVVANGAKLEFTGTISNSGGDYTSNGTGELEFDGVTTYTGGTLNVTGIIQQNGDATVSGNTTITGERFDLDGDLGAGVDWIVSGGASLVLNVTSVESVGTGGTFDGTMTVNSGSILNPASMTINLTGGAEWTMAGTLTTNGPGGAFILTTIGAGTPFNLTGTANVNGNNAWAARVDVSGTITVNAGSTLRLTGGTLIDPNRLVGGTITGTGTLSALTDDALHGFGTINTPINFLGNAELRADNGTLTVSGAINDVGTIGTADTDGRLNVTNPWNTSVADQLELKGGEVSGAAITNGGTTTGFGSITSTSFSNNNVTSANGGTLTLNSAGFPDLDGITETGVLNAVNGNLAVPGNFGGPFVFDGTLNVGTNRQFSMPVTPLINDGVVNLTGGTLSVRGYRQTQVLTVNPGLSAISELGNGIQFDAGSSTTLNGDLQLVGGSLINAGASFSGPRQLIVPAGASNLRLAGGATVGVGITNQGRMEVGVSPGIALVQSFTQAASGTYEAEIDGLLVGTQYDQLQVTSAALLAGTLDVLINQNGGTYADPVGAGSFHVFTLITAGSVGGTFGTVLYAGAPLVPAFGVGPGGDFVALASCGLFRVVDYSNTDLQLINYRALPGDANGDGFVDGGDFNIWNANKGLGGTNWTRGDFNCDGSTNNLDFNIWFANRFTSVALPLLAGGNPQAYIPEPAGLLPWFLAVACILRRRTPASFPGEFPGERGT